MNVLIALAFAWALSDTGAAPAAAKPAAMKVRHGIAHIGCSHFQLQNQDAVMAWGQANGDAIAARVPDPSLEGFIANPELFLEVAFQLLFPECGDWKAATFGPTRETYAEALARVLTQLQGLEGSSMSTTSTAGFLFARFLS